MTSPKVIETRRASPRSKPVRLLAEAQAQAEYKVKVGRSANITLGSRILAERIKEGG